MKYKSDCVCCSKVILTENEVEKSNKTHGLTLCIVCEKEHIKGLRGSTVDANRLFFALKGRNLDALLQHKEKFKTIDIYIPSAMLHIEVDGAHHNTDAEQAFRDLMRTYHSAKEGYFTLRIPNTLVKNKLKKAIDIIVNICDLLTERNRPTKMRKAS